MYQLVSESQSLFGYSGATCINQTINRCVIGLPQ